MLQHHQPGDYVVATGKTWSVRQVLDIAFGAVGIDDWTPYVATDERFRRPAEVDHLVGDASKAHAGPGLGTKGSSSPRCSKKWSTTHIAPGSEGGSVLNDLR